MVSVSEARVDITSSPQGDGNSPIINNPTGISKSDVVDITSSPQGDGNLDFSKAFVLSTTIRLTLHLPRKGMETTSLKEAAAWFDALLVDITSSPQGDGNSSLNFQGLNKK